MCFGLTNTFAGMRQHEMLNLQADLNRQQAEFAEEAGEIRAQNLREEGKRRVSAARAALAASGVNVDVGTGSAIQSDITRKAEKDAQTGIADAKNQAELLRLGATINELNADFAIVEGVTEDITAMASAAMHFGGGFTGTAPGSSGG